MRDPIDGKVALISEVFLNISMFSHKNHHMSLVNGLFMLYFLDQLTGHLTRSMQKSPVKS